MMIFMMKTKNWRKIKKKRKKVLLESVKLRRRNQESPQQSPIHAPSALKASHGEIE